MTVPPQERDICFRPLFEFALSGEIEYIKSGERQIHTLGRIAYDTCVNGSMGINQDCMTQFPEFSDRLSWEPSVGVLVDGDFDKETGQTIVNGVSFTHDSGLTFDIRDSGDRDPFGKKRINVVVGPPEVERSIRVDLSPRLHRATNLVTISAQKYFTTINRLQA